MNKGETMEIVMAIEGYFNNALTRNNNPFSKAETVEEKIVEIVNVYHRALKDFDFDRVMDNLIKYSLENEYPPKIKNLVEGLVVNEKYNIPGIEETKKILDGYQVKDHLKTEQIRALLEEKLGKDWKNRRPEEWKR